MLLCSVVRSHGEPQSDVFPVRLFRDSTNLEGFFLFSRRYIFIFLGIYLHALPKIKNKQKDCSCCVCFGFAVVTSGTVKSTVDLWSKIFANWSVQLNAFIYLSRLFSNHKQYDITQLSLMIYYNCRKSTAKELQLVQITVDAIYFLYDLSTVINDSNTHFTCV